MSIFLTIIAIGIFVALARKFPSDCNQDCNQGRNCTCQQKEK